jgi:hypothetical protein
MKTSILLAAAVLSTAGVAHADNADAVAGRYEVKYDEVTSNCQNTGMVLLRGVMDVTKRKASSVAVDIDRIPLMAGTAAKAGRIKATSKLGPTSIQGLDGRFSLAGSVNEDSVLSMVLVAEYYVKNKAYCTQSWNVSGVRAGGAESRGKKTADESFAVSPMHWMPPAE